MAELETALKAARSSRSRDRLTAIRALIFGQRHEDVAVIFNVTQRSVQRWVRAFNASGIDGLIERTRPGRPRKIHPKQSDQLCQLIEHPEQAGEVHWTGKKFHGYLRRELKVEVGYSTVMRWLHEQNFRLKVPQPWPDRQDEAQRQEFVRELRRWLSDEQIELWFADETGIEGDPRPRRRWAKKGDKPRVTKNGDHLRMNVTGVICPRTGEMFAFEYTHSDRECFQDFLNRANNAIGFGRRRNLFICDNASWHKSKTLRWGRFEPVYLPPYSPDLNPIERLWLLIKAHWFADFIAKTHDQLVQRIDTALCWAMDRGVDNRQTCSIKTEL